MWCNLISLLSKKTAAVTLKEKVEDVQLDTSGAAIKTIYRLLLSYLNILLNCKTLMILHDLDL